MRLDAAEDRALLELARQLDGRGYRFVTPTPLTHARVNARPDNAMATDLAGVFGWSRPFERTLLPATLFEVLCAAGELKHDGRYWRSDVRLSSLCGQLFLHSAFPTDAADAVFFGPDTYRFANALESCLAHRERAVRRAADIGCGAGAGAILIAGARPDAEVLALDINPAALRLAAVNAAAADTHNVRTRHSDLLNATRGSFDLIVANPPYLVDPAERAYRHGGGTLGEALSFAIVDAALPRLVPGGTLLLYTGIAMRDNHDPFLTRLRARLKGWHWHYREVDPDVFGEELMGDAYDHCERIAAVVLHVDAAL
jgi:methylase of polypeptide subunit release factors